MTDQEASNLETVRTLVNEMIAAVGDSAARGREVYPGWRVIDVLGHLVFWHRSSAANLGAIARGERPPLLRGRLQDLNRESVELGRQLTPEQLVSELLTAQETIERNWSRTQPMPYRAGSRVLTPNEQLEWLITHLRSHLRDLRKANSR